MPTDPNTIDPLRLSADHLADLIGVEESQNLDFKRSMSTNDEGKREFLRDVVAMTNGGGGYLVIGAIEERDVCTGLCHVENAEGLIQTINLLMLDGVAERIGGVVIRRHTVSGGDLITVFLPPESPHRPHMVCKEKRTEFLCRYGRDKRAMTTAEIRQMFMGDSVSRRLDTMQELLGQLAGASLRQQNIARQEQELASTARFHEVTDGGVLRKGLRDAFLTRCKNENRKLFRISISPDAPRPTITPENEAEIIRLCQSPPNQRRNGWNVGGLREYQRRIGAIVFGGDGHYELNVWTNGGIEFINDAAHLGWTADQYGVTGHDYIHPYPLIEYAVSFARLASTCYGALRLGGAVTVEYEIIGLEGAILRPYSPNAWGFQREYRESPIPGIYAKSSCANIIERPDAAAFSVVREIYHHFGYDDSHIPFFRDHGTTADIQ
jgi:hypothetical protein